MACDEAADINRLVIMLLKSQVFPLTKERRHMQSF